MLINRIAIFRMFIIAAICCLFLAGHFIDGANAQQIIIIANKKVPVNSLTGDEIENIYLGKKTQWPDNTHIPFAVLKDEAIHEQFVKIHVKKTSSQFMTYWRKQIFTGKGKPPAALDMKQMIEFVANTDGAVGYVTSDQSVGNVKVLTIQ